jgi:RNA polymerase-binding transcription factor DksA
MDRADLGTQRAEVELTGTLADLAARRLDEIDRALDRSAHGQLGRCAACGREIALGRLRAIPGTDRCLACANSAARA